MYTIDRLLVPPQGDLHQTLAHHPDHKVRGSVAAPDSKYRYTVIKDLFS